MNIILIVLILFAAWVFYQILFKLKDWEYYKEVFFTQFENVYVNINQTESNTKQKILILSTDDRNERYIQLHRKSLQKYCDHHGYTFLFTKPCTDLPVYFCKFKQILELMNKGEYDYYIWIDSDTIVNRNFIQFPLEAMLETVGLETDVITGNFPIHNILKYLIGSFYVFKNNSQTKALLQRCINDIDPSKWNNPKKGECNYGGYCYEEASLYRCIDDTIKHRRIIGQFISNHPWCAPNYFIMHISRILKII